MLQCIVLSYDSFHLEWTRKIYRQLWQNHPHEVVQVILPPTNIVKTVAITLLSNKVRLVDVIHSKIIKHMLQNTHKAMQLIAQTA